MGGNRRTRSSRTRGSSQPPSGSAATIRTYFNQPPMSEDERDKMAPAASSSATRPQRQQPSAAPSTLHNNEEQNRGIDGLSGQGTTAVSPPPPLPAHETPRSTPRDTLPGRPAPSYTQCSEAFPQLLRSLSDPYLPQGGTISPTPSLQPSDFPPLPDPEGDWSSDRGQGTHHGRFTPQQVHGPPPSTPQPQRHGHQGASRSMGQGTDHTTSYAQVARSPNRTPLDNPVGAHPFSPKQRPAWEDPRAPKIPHQRPSQDPYDPMLPPALHRESSPPSYPQSHMGHSSRLQQPTSWQDCFQAIPTKEDFKLLIEEVKSACRAEIQIIHTNLKHLSERMEMAEEEIQETRLAVHRTQIQGADHHLMLRNMQRHIEDLDNRGRRNNIRIRGLPEPEGPEDLHETLQLLFNDLLGDPPDKPLEMDRAHRALRPKGPPSRPRDVICRVHSFPLKEDIMRKARSAKRVVFENTLIQLFPDLSWITLQKRRLLQPLLILLQEKNITYRWGFPFSLTARHQGKSATLRFPEDLENFCDILEIPTPRLPDWDLVDLPTPPPVVWQKIPPTKRPRDRDSPRGSTKLKPKKG